MLADENVLLSLHGHVHAGGKLDMYMQNNIE